MPFNLCWYPNCNSRSHWALLYFTVVVIMCSGVYQVTFEIILELLLAKKMDASSLTCLVCVASVCLFFLYIVYIITQHSTLQSQYVLLV